MTDSEETREERWTCAGVRVFDGSKRMIAWQRPDEERLRYFSDKGHWVTGGVYQVEVSAAPDGKRVVRHGQPQYLNPHPDAQLRQQYRAEEVADLAILEKLARERSDAKVDALNDAMEPLVKLYKGLRTGAQRDAFTAHVINQLNKAWWA